MICQSLLKKFIDQPTKLIKGRIIKNENTKEIKEETMLIDSKGISRKMMAENVIVITEKETMIGIKGKMMDLGNKEKVTMTLEIKKKEIMSIGMTEITDMTEMKEMTGMIEVKAMKKMTEMENMKEMTDMKEMKEMTDMNQEIKETETTKTKISTKDKAIDIMKMREGAITTKEIKGKESRIISLTEKIEIMKGTIILENFKIKIEDKATKKG